MRACQSVQKDFLELAKSKSLATDDAVQLNDLFLLFHPGLQSRHEVAQTLSLCNGHAIFFRSAELFLYFDNFLVCSLEVGFILLSLSSALARLSAGRDVTNIGRLFLSLDVSFPCGNTRAGLKMRLLKYLLQLVDVHESALSELWRRPFNLNGWLIMRNLLQHLLDLVLLLFLLCEWLE
jgi:hypothetical protein